MTPRLLVLIVTCLLPLVLALLLHGARQPLLRLLPVYAAVVPFGSGLALPGLPASWFSASSLLGLVLCLALSYRLVVGGPIVRGLPAAAGVWLLYAALCATTVYWSLVPSDTLGAFVPMLAGIALYVLVRLTPADARVLRRFEWGAIGGGAAVAVYGLVQLAAGGLSADAGARLGDELNDPNHLAASLLLPFALALSRAVAPSRVSVGLGSTAAATLMLVAVVLTASRGGLLGLGVVVLVLALAGLHRARVLVVAGLVMALAAGLLATLPGGVHDRLLSGGTSGRTDVWRVAANACTEHCLTGSGWGTFGEVYARTLPSTPDARVNPRRTNFEPHNNVLLVAVETGVLGLLLVLLGLGLAVREALHPPAFRRGLPLAALLGLLTTGMLVGNLEFKYFWLVLMYVGLTSALRSGQAPAPGADDLVRPVLSGGGVR